MSNSPFEIKSSEYVPAVRSRVTISEDPASGAVLVHLLCEEERENFFAACFRTHPADDTGVPHIIEHTVLNGSARYPVKDPFMEMVKSSMATFINALTYGDRTVYPCGSLNRTDFLNLVAVYMDAVFNPLLKKEFFLQEGYRLDFSEEDGKLTHSGVVYNEMKGAYSDPDSYIEREVARALYPDGSCGKDSGGDPSAITQLTYSMFTDFYSNHYSPSNCCFFALTQIPFQDFSEFIAERLSAERNRKSAGKFVSQTQFKNPVHKEMPVPGNGDGCTIMRAWKVNTAGDPVETLAFSLLEDVLLEDDSSPVRATLLDSDLGTGLSACGYDFDPFERNFIIGLKGVQRNNSKNLFKLIEETLISLSDNGLKKELVRDMLHRKELRLKYTGSGWPMALMSTVTAAWTHGEDIMQSLDLNNVLNGLKSRMAEDPLFLEKMIERWLVKNPHRADLVFYPDDDHFQKEEELIAKELEQRKLSMDPEELRKLGENSRNLQRSMNTPNTPEELATLPKLNLSDVSGYNGNTYHRTEDTGNGLLLSTDIHTAGLCYIDLAMDLTGLHGEFVPYLSFYADLITRTGAGKKDHIQMAEEELSCSGGINASVKCSTDTVFSTDEHRLILKVSGYCLNTDLPKMLDMISRRILVPDVENRKRIAAVAGEMTEHERSSLIPRGHTIALLHARSGLSQGHYASNLLNGIPSLKLLSSVNRRNAGEHAEALRAIREHINSGVPGTLAWTGPEKERSTVLQWLSKMPLNSMDKISCSPIGSQQTPKLAGIKTGPGTCFAAAALPGVPIKNPMAAPGIVMLRMLSEGFLWDQIRVRRGAYGAGASLAGGAVSFYSYRDPSPADSLRLFREAIAEGHTKLDLTRRAVEDSIIASLKGTDPPVRPAMANGIAIMRHLRGLSIDLIEEYRNSLLAVTRGSIGDFADWLSSSSNSLSVCVMGSDDCLKSASVTEFIEL